MRSLSRERKDQAIQQYKTSPLPLSKSSESLTHTLISYVESIFWGKWKKLFSILGQSDAKQQLETRDQEMIPPLSFTLMKNLRNPLKDLIYFSTKMFPNAALISNKEKHKAHPPPPESLEWRRGLVTLQENGLSAVSFESRRNLYTIVGYNLTRGVYSLFTLSPCEFDRGPVWCSVPTK